MSGNESEMKWISQGDPDGLVAMVREKMSSRSASHQPGAPMPPSTHVGGDIPEQIKKLAELRDSGILSEAEFTEKKQDLLSRM
jgi:hypothetical protein